MNVGREGLDTLAEKYGIQWEAKPTSVPTECL